MEETMERVEETMEDGKERVEELTGERMTRKDKLFLAGTGVASAVFGFAVGWTARGKYGKAGETDEITE